MSNEQQKNQPEAEKIVSLNEDSKSHQHDEASYEKLIKEQQQAQEQKK